MTDEPAVEKPWKPPKKAPVGPPHLMTRKQFFHFRVSVSIADGNKHWLMKGYARKQMPWQMAWDLAAYDKLWGHVRAIKDAIEDHGIETLTAANYIEYEIVLRRWLSANVEHQAGNLTGTAVAAGR